MVPFLGPEIVSFWSNWQYGRQILYFPYSYMFSSFSPLSPMCENYHPKPALIKHIINRPQDPWQDLLLFQQIRKDHWLTVTFGPHTALVWLGRSGMFWKGKIRIFCIFLCCVQASGRDVAVSGQAWEEIGKEGASYIEWRGRVKLGLLVIHHCNVHLGFERFWIKHY